MEGKELRKKMKLVNVSAFEMSKDLNISQPTISNILNGWVDLKLEREIKINEYLEVKKKELLKALIA